MAISKSRRGSCSSSRNTNRLLLPSPLDLHLGRLLFLALLASCSALAIETTEVPEVIEATTIIPAQIEESLSTQTSTNQNETISAHPVENPKADTADPAVFAQSSAAEVQDSFVSVYGGNLEQDIKNDVNIEVEEAPSPAETLKETASKVAEVAVVETENHETESAVQNAREPKTLETQEEEGKPAPEDQAEPETVTDNIAVASEQVESRSNSRPLPKVTSDLVSVILNEDRAITEQPITKTNLLALEQEHKAVTSENIGTPEPTYEEPKHQVTKKQGVEDLLPIEVAPEVDEPETVREERQFEEPNSNLNEIDGNTSEDEKANPTTFFKSAGELQEQIEKKSEEEAKAEIEKEVEGTAPPQETVVEAADAEDSQPGEEEVVLGTTEKSVHEETNPIEGEPKEDEDKEKENKENEFKEDQLKKDQLKEADIQEEELNNEEPKENQLKEDQLKVEQLQEEQLKEEQLKEEQPKEEEPKEKEPEVEKSKDEELKKEELKEVETKEEEQQEEVTIHQIDSEEPIVLGSPSSTQKPVEENVPLKTDRESVEDKDEEPKSLEDKENDPGSSEPKEDKDDSNSDSSEETQESAADEAKPSSSDDSTATPLVSYPPHDAGQTFDSNSADEHSAQLSGPSNYRSTLIIALCSGTAVIFIVASLVIFVVSFQRQHGTLDIEMQEQRLGKDDRDEEDAQVKLLEVDLSTPVIVSLGNEETDECL